MTEEARLREIICELAKPLFDRGLTHGSTGNILARTPDGGLLVSPTGTSFGRLDPSRLSRFDAEGRHVSGDQPTKEMPLTQCLLRYPKPGWCSPPSALLSRCGVVDDARR